MPEPRTRKSVDTTSGGAFNMSAIISGGRQSDPVLVCSRSEYDEEADSSVRPCHGTQGAIKMKTLSYLALALAIPLSLSCNSTPLVDPNGDGGGDGGDSS